jgi:hypothetical protein
VPFHSATGEFGEEIGPESDRSLFNDLSTSLVVVFEVDSEAGSLEAGAGSRSRSGKGRTRSGLIGPIGESGRRFEPLKVKITASVIGQKLSMALTRTVTFNCGE